MTDPLVVSIVAAIIWLFGLICGIWLADYICSAFEVFFDLFRRPR